LVLCPGVYEGEYELGTLASRYKPIGPSTISWPETISKKTLDELVMVKEVDPEDFPLYVGWAWVSPKLADLIKNL
jgi:hypothetical protein